MNARYRWTTRADAPWFALAAGLLITAAACGGGEEGDGAGTEGTETVATSDDEQPQETQQVGLRLNWVVAGNHAPFFLAKERGSWAECGLDVTIRRGQGSGDTAQLVANGSEEFGLADAASIAPGRLQGMPIKSIGVLYQDNPSGVVSLKEAGIEELEDIEGKTFGAVPGGSPYQLYKWVVQENNIDEESTREVSVAAPGIAQLVTGQVDFITYFTNEAANVDPSPDEKLNVIAFRDYGLNVYGLALATNEQFMESQPAAVRCFVEGVLRGLESAEEDPDAALDALFAANPEAEESSEVHRQLLDGIWEYIGDDPLAQNADGWDRTQQTLEEAGIVEGDLTNPEKFFTNEFQDR